jgi:hypothetical protein
VFPLRPYLKSLSLNSAAQANDAGFVWNTQNFLDVRMAAVCPVAEIAVSWTLLVIGFANIGGLRR